MLPRRDSSRRFCVVAPRRRESGDATKSVEKNLDAADTSVRATKKSKKLYCGRIQMSSRTLTEDVMVWPPTVSRTM